VGGWRVDKLQLWQIWGKGVDLARLTGLHRKLMHKYLSKLSLDSCSGYSYDQGEALLMRR
jgi:hypothetical protein